MMSQTKSTFASLRRLRNSIKKAGKKILKALAYVLSWSPVFCVSDDNNFHDVKLSSSNCRYSLIYLGLGSTKLYLITYHGKLKFWHKLNLDDYFILGKEEISNLIEKYNEHLTHLTDDLVENESEFLTYLIDKEEERLNMSFTKINSYVTILSIIFPLFIAFCTQYISLITSAHFLIFFVLYMVIYSSFNVWRLIINSYSVRGYSFSTFREVKNDNSMKNLAKSYYFDWQNIKRKAELFVSFVLNIRDYFNWLIVSILAFVILMIVPQFLQSYNLNTVTKKNEYILKMDNGSLQENGQIQLHNIEKCLIEKKIKSIIIDASNTDDLNKISSNIDTYVSKKVIVTKVVDNRYPKEQISIKIQWR